MSRLQPPKCFEPPRKGLFTAAPSNTNCLMGVHGCRHKCMHGFCLASCCRLGAILASSCISCSSKQGLAMCGCSMAPTTQKRYHCSLWQAPQQHQPWQCQSLGSSSWRSSTKIRQAPAVRRHPSLGQDALLHLGMQCWNGCVTKIPFRLVPKHCLVGDQLKVLDPST